VLLPARITEILTETDNRAGDDAVAKRIEDGFGRGVQITIDIHKRDRFCVAGGEARQGLIEPAGVDLDVVRHIGRRALFIESARLVPAIQCSGKPSKESKPCTGPATCRAI